MSESMRSQSHPEPEIARVFETLDQETDAAATAAMAGYSRAQFYRKVARILADPPMTVRRRLLLERAAYRITRTRTSITEIAFDAGFESLEGFLRSFKRHFGVAPGKYRRLGPSDYRIDATERIHYAPPAGPVGSPRQGEATMKLFERLIDHHGWSMNRIIERCRTLTDAQLDAELSARCPFPWHDRAETLRSLLRANVGFAEPWLDSINGEKVEGPRESLEDLQGILSENCRRFTALANSIEDEGRWDMTFVDALCEPPEVFSYLGVAGHVVTFNAYRRVLLLNELKKLGIGDLGFGDPIEYDPARRPAGT